MDRKLPRYRAIAQALNSLGTCSADWEPKWRSYLQRVADHMPSGSGIDSGTKICDTSTPERIVLIVDYHKMDQNGYYCGWTTFKVIVTPSLRYEFEMRITGRDWQGVKEYLAEVYQHALNESILVDPS